MNLNNEHMTRHERIDYVNTYRSKCIKAYEQESITRNKCDLLQNDFIKLLDKNLCVNWGCTTCGNMLYRKKVKELGIKYITSIMELNECDVIKYNNILEYVNIGIYCIQILEQRKQMATHWPNIFHMISIGTRQSLEMIIHRSTFIEFTQ